MFAAGSVLGSFINAASWRLHEGKDWIRGRSQCVHCGHTLAGRDLVPVVSWLWLAGRCRYCGQPISRRYPIVELITGAIFVWSFLVWDFSPALAGLALVVWLAMAIGLILLADYDLRWMILPDKILLPLIGLAIIQLIVFSALEQSVIKLVDALGAATLAGLFFYGLFAYSHGRWLGGGDVKLVFLMGLVLGLVNTMIALLIAFNAAALLSVALIAIGRMSRKDYIPFGPFLIGGSIIAMLHGAQLFDIYSRMFLTY